MKIGKEGGAMRAAEAKPQHTEKEGLWGADIIHHSVFPILKIN